MSIRLHSSRRRLLPHLTRRDFLKTSAAASAAALAGGCAMGDRREAPGVLHAAHRLERIRVGLIGCGGRGRDAALDALKADDNTVVTALGDLFQDRLDEGRKWLTEEAGKAGKAERVQVTDDHCFVGWDAYQNVINAGVHLVILATPPHFRPQHLHAAISTGKHVFMEKPVAVDPVGARSVIASSDLAARKGLAIVAGTQRRHDPAYVETMKRIQEGWIGDVVAGQCYWNQGPLWVKKREPGWSDMEWQCRNWLYFTWLSGDHIVEQHVHNLDVMNWALGGPPLKCVGMGGRQSRTAEEYGNIWDHFACEFEYANGARVLSMCRQVQGASERISERVVGTRGVANPDGVIEGRRKYKYEGQRVNPYVQEHRDLIASIRSGRPLNEGRRIAESTLTAIMGRISAYTGREVQWSWVMNSSALDLTPPKYEFGDLAIEPVAVPGQTKLV